MYRLYYNAATAGDVLYVVIRPEATPDNVKKRGDVVTLFAEGKRIGINFLAISKTIKIKASGMIPIVPEELLKALNSLLANVGEEPLPEQNDSRYRVAEVLSTEEHPLDEKKKIIHLSLGETKLDTVSRYANLVPGVRTVVALDGCLKADSSEFVSHVERNIPIQAEVCSPKDLLLGEEETKAFETDKAPGADFFLTK